MTKTFKSPIDKLIKKGILGTTVDLDPNWYENAIKKENELRENARKEEQERIDKLKCPSCKSTDKEHIINSNNNGIIGPGYSSWVIDEYFACNNCGTMFRDISKTKKK